MKKAIIITIALVVASQFTAVAKNYMLMGKVAYMSGANVAKGKLSATGNGKIVTPEIDANGLYNTIMLPEGKYKVTIETNNATYTTDVVVRSPANNTYATFYNFKLDSKTVTLNITIEDSFVQVAAVKAKNSSDIIDYPPNMLPCESLKDVINDHTTPDIMLRRRLRDDGMNSGANKSMYLKVPPNDGIKKK